MAVSICDLPNEVLFKVLSELDFADIYSLLQIPRLLRRMGDLMFLATDRIANVLHTLVPTKVTVDRTIRLLQEKSFYFGIVELHDLATNYQHVHDISEMIDTHIYSMQQVDEEQWKLWLDHKDPEVRWGLPPCSYDPLTEYAVCKQCIGRRSKSFVFPGRTRNAIVDSRINTDFIRLPDLKVLHIEHCDWEESVHYFPSPLLEELSIAGDFEEAVSFFNFEDGHRIKTLTLKENEQMQLWDGLGFSGVKNLSLKRYENLLEFRNSTFSHLEKLVIVADELVLFSNIHLPQLSNLCIETTRELVLHGVTASLLEFLKIQTGGLLTCYDNDFGKLPKANISAGESMSPRSRGWEKDFLGSDSSDINSDLSCFSYLLSVVLNRPHEILGVTSGLKFLTITGDFEQRQEVTYTLPTLAKISLKSFIHPHHWPFKSSSELRELSFSEIGPVSAELLQPFYHWHPHLRASPIQFRRLSPKLSCPPTHCISENF